MSRDYEPAAGQWYEDLDTEETFQVLALDPDQEIVRIQWLDREVQDIDLDVWNEMDLELATEPEGWVDDVEGDDDDEADVEEKQAEEEEDDWDDEDEDWDDDEDYDDDDDEYRDRE